MKTKLFLLFLFFSAFAFAQFPTSGLIAQYGFDNGSLFTDGANGQNFTQTGNALTEINDRFNNPPTSAINLNGDYLTRSDIAISGSTGLDFAVTYSFWLNTSTNNNDIKTVIDDSSRDTDIGFDGNDVGYYIYYRDGKISLSSRYYAGDFASPIAAYGYGHTHPQVISDGSWHHVVVEFSPTFISGVQRINSKIYIDGVLNSKSIFPTAPFTTSPNTTGNVTIANSRFNHLALANQYTDVFDDLLIYNRKLTAIEVSTIANYNNYCFTPLSSILTVSTISETTATVDISNDNNVFDLAYHKVSEPFSSAIIISGITSATAQSQVSLTGLDVFTDYLVYVREQCVNVTDWSGSVAFKTTRPLGKLYVNKNATGGNNGLSWADAFIDLQDALSTVTTNEDIWIAQGVYTPHASDRSVYFVIDKENLKLYGGFTGTEANVSDRVLGANETILSGDLQTNDVNVSDFPANYANTTRNADNSYRVINILATGNNLLLDGLTISDAHNNANATSRGSAIFKDKTVSLLTLKNCIIKDNLGRNDNAGLLAEFELNNRVSGARGALIIENCQFINNMSRWASGIYSFVRNDTHVDITVANTLFDGNLSGNLSSTVKGISGSASWFRVIGSMSNVTLNLSNNTYVNNIDLGTDQSLNNFSRATVGISRDTGITSPFNVTVNNCIFWDNTTVGGVTTRSITDLYKLPASSLVINNSIDASNFNDDSITSKNATTNANPLFTDAANGNFTLSSGSPAIDSGDNTYVYGAEDLLGNQRIFNTTVDMGVYEFGATLGITTFDFNANEIKLYPNPTRSVLNIKMKANIKQATIYSVLGAQILQTTSKTINTTNLKSGMYLITIENESGTVSTKRFIKQ